MADDSTGDGGRDDGDAARREQMLAELHRPIRPRAGRWIPWAVAVAGAATFIVVGFALPGSRLVDGLSFTAVAALLVWILARYAEVVARPGTDGLTVRNLIHTRHLPWEQIVTVTFGRDSTWATLDLADGTTAPVMAIQAADGRHAHREADRLATLVEYHSRRGRPGVPDE